MCAIAPHDSQHGSIRTMARISGSAQFAVSAAGVDFADYPLPGGELAGRHSRKFFNDANELVTQGALKAGVTARYFQIGVANSGKRNAHQGFTVSLRPGHFGEMKLPVFVAKSFHDVVSGQP